jgi:hypothetical protein
MSASWASHLYTRDLWMCWKSRRWWAQHARHFHLYEVTGNQLRPNPLLTQSILQISELVWPGQKLVTSVWGGERLNTPPPIWHWPAPFLDLTVQPCGELCRSAAEFDFLIVKVNEIKRKHPSFSAWIYPRGVWSLFYNCKVQNSISLGCCKKQKWSWTFTLSCFAEWKKRVEPCCLFLCRTMHGRKTCARRQEKQAPDRASEATSLLPIWDLETWFVLHTLSFASSLAESLSLFHPPSLLPSRV